MVTMAFSSNSMALTVRWVLFAAGLGSWLPRRDTTAACGSQERPWFRRRTAPRGQGGRGWEGQRGPWPRTRIQGEIPHEAWDRCEKENEMWMVQFSWWMLFSIFLESLPKEMHQHFLLCFEIRTVSFPSPRSVFRNRILGSDFFYRRFL